MSEIKRKYTALKEGQTPNVVQEMIWADKLLENKNNVVIATKTGSGKTMALTMYGTDYLEKEKIAVYVGSFRALVQEKCDDFAEPEHPWNKYARTTINGDYTYDDNKLIEIANADIVTITPESFLSILRHPSSEKAAFLNHIGVVFVDEIHLAGEDERGATLEVMLMELTKDYPKIKLVMMSGTIINPQDLCQWATNLNGRETTLIESDYRPVPITYEWLPFYEFQTFQSEKERIQMILDIVTSPEKKREKFMIAIFKKAFGEKIVYALKEAGFQAVAFNADIKSVAEKKSVVQSFIKGGTQIIVTTSVAFAGINWPARNVIVTHMQAGMSPVRVTTLQQIAGRAGRQGFDTEGFVYFFSPHKDLMANKKRYEAGVPISSQLLEKKTLAMHFLGAVYMKKITNLEEFAHWFRRSLAYVQGHKTAEQVLDLVQEVITVLCQCGMLKNVEGNLSLTHLGTITAQMMLDPFYVSDIVRNFNVYFSRQAPTDVDLAVALGKASPFYTNYCSPEMTKEVPEVIKRSCDKEFWPTVAGIYYKLKGDEIPKLLYGGYYVFIQDSARLEGAMLRICQEVTKWHDWENGSELATDRIKLIFNRVRTGEGWGRSKLALNKFTPSERKALEKCGIFSVEDARKNIDQARIVLKPKRLKEMGIE